MAKTTFSGPVRSGYQGGSQGNLPLTPTTINTGNVLSIKNGTGAYGFYTRVQPTTGLEVQLSNTWRSLWVFGRTQSGVPFATTPQLHLTM
jgi:hypothetical protein